MAIRLTPQHTTGGRLSRPAGAGTGSTDGTTRLLVLLSFAAIYIIWWIALLSLLWSDGRRTTVTTVFGLFLGFVGVALLSTDQPRRQTGSS